MENSAWSNMEYLRVELIKSCNEYLNVRKEVVHKALKGLKDDLENESKSSAGDKYETGREMINIEWNKLQIQLNEYERLGAILKRIQRFENFEKVILGSIIQTEAVNYFISIPAGEIRIGEKKFYAVGIQSPVAQQLIGKKEGELFELNGKSIKISEIY